jgi:hypothetical protein
MLRIVDSTPALSPGMSRRVMLGVGGIGLGGLSLSTLLASRSQASTSKPAKAKSVIIFGLVGGPPQHESWDPKPNAPQEVRGQFGTIATRTPGFRVGELMPRIATLTNKLAVLRAVVTNDNAHSSSGYQMLTGIPHIPLSQESAAPKAPNNHPSIGALLRAVRPESSGLPSAITIPEHLWNDGNFPWPGQDAGFLGNRHNPWLIHCDPSDPTFGIPSLSLPGDMPALRFNERRSLLEQVNSHYDATHRLATASTFSQHAQKANELLHSPNARKAFDLQSESPALRERYGTSRFAQSCLLARRLVEAGVGLVQVNWTRIKDQPNGGGWDTHTKHSESIKSLLMPIQDQAFSALIEDLDLRGLLDETLVVWFGEFGRTPHFNKDGGRDHWGSCFSLALAGGGIKGGVVHGASDKSAAFAMEGKVEPADIIATIFHCLGINPETEIRDAFDRPIPISRGQVIKAIL